MGREDTLDKIDKSFSHNKVFILSSCAGMGKSTIANEFGYRFKAKNSKNYVFWMKSDEKNIESEFKNFAFNLDILIDHQTNQETLVKQISHKLNSLEDEKILLIFDNCDNYQNIACYLYNFPENVFILVTTRDGTLFESIQQIADHFIVEPFEENESLDFIKKNLGNRLKTDQDLLRLFSLVSLNFENKKIRPYLLNNMIAFIKLKIGLIKDAGRFIEKAFQDIKIKMFNEQDQLFNELINSNKPTWSLLTFSSFLDPDFVPIKIFTQLLQIDEDQLDMSIQFLTRLSILKVEEIENETGLRMHRSLQQEIQQYLKIKSKKNELNAIISKYVEILTHILSDCKESLKSKNLNKQTYYYNVKALTENILKEESYVSNEAKANLRFNFGNYNFNLEKYEEALKYYENSLYFYKQAEKKYSEISNTLNNMGETYDHIGNHGRAIELYQESLIIKEKYLNTSQNSVSIAYTLNNIGLAYAHLGSYKDSLVYCERSLAIQNMSSEKLTELQANTLHNLGFVYFNIGHYKQAIENFKKSLAFKKEFFQTTENLSISNTMMYLAYTFMFVRDEYDKSLEILKNSLKMKLAFHGSNENVESIAINLILLGFANYMLKNYEKAIEYSKKSSLICSKICKENVEQIRFYGDHFVIFGKSYLKLKIYDKSIENLSKAMEIYKKKFKTENNFRIAECLKNIGLAKFYLNDFKEAKECYDKALEIYEIIYDDLENFRLADLYENIALFHDHFGAYKEASKFYNYSINIRKKHDQIRAV